MWMLELIRQTVKFHDIYQRSECHLVLIDGT